MARFVALAILGAWFVAGVPRGARAQELDPDTLAVGPSGRSVRPTSGDVSILSGRTVGNGEVVLAGALGWPRAEVLLAPSSRFNVEIRGAVSYGSPFMGFGTAVGGEISVPMRYLVWAEDHLDLSAYARPLVVLGEGRLVGQTGVFSDDFGWGVGFETGMKLGFQASDAVTLAGGLLGTFAWVDVSDADGAAGAIGSIQLMAGLEALMSRSTMLFVEAVGGVGFSGDGRFDSRGVVRLSLGIAYLL